MAAELGLIEVATGSTVKRNALLEEPFTVTTRSPLLPNAGTRTVTDEELHDVTDATTPLNVTALAPCEVPKLLPVIVTAVPAVPVDNEVDAMAGVTVNVIHLATNITATVRTTAGGDYNAPNLSPGRYRVEISAAGPKSKSTQSPFCSQRSAGGGVPAVVQAEKIRSIPRPHDSI